MELESQLSSVQMDHSKVRGMHWNELECTQS